MATNQSGGAPSSSDANEPRGGSATVSRVVSVIDYSAGASVAGQIEELASGLDTSGPIYLDLTVIPAEGGDSPKYRVVETPAAGGQRPLSCEPGDRFYSRSFDFEFNPDYNHLVLQVVHGPADVAPYSTAACEYRGGSGAPVFTIRGHYVVSKVDIPTARDIQLRPAVPRTP